MKKLVAVLLLMCVIFGTVTGCKKKSSDSAEEPSAEEVVEIKDPQIAEFFDKIVNSDERPISVMIDNDDNGARPQIGLNRAYLVYEIVVEGAATRYMALFKGDNVEKIGPVRSSRHYFLDYAMENDCIYSHVGWSPKASHDISGYGINNINGILGPDGVAFWRDSTITKNWHTTYTSIEKLKDFAKKKNYSFKTDAGTVFTYSDEYITPQSESFANKIEIAYAGFYRTAYTYNAETKHYTKNVNGKDYVMQDGSMVEPKNLVILFVENYDLNDGEDKGRQNIDNIGSGNGYYFSEGKMVNINWSKADRKAKTVYTLENGEPLVINPGQTFVNFVDKDLKLTIE